jgi:hypothetical protein
MKLSADRFGKRLQHVLYVGRSRARRRRSAAAASFKIT